MTSEEQIESSATRLLFSESDLDRGKEKHHAERLGRPPGTIVATIIELILCLLIIGFLAFAVLAFWLKGSPIGTPIGNHIEQAMKVGSTLYPIIFAALLSRTLRNIGRYKAQKGTRLLTLWTLMNTNSTVDPIAQLLTKPKSLLLGFLVVMWILSPLGSQSTLRLVYPLNTTEFTNYGIRYWDSGPLGNMYAYNWVCVAGDGAMPLSMIDMYLATLMQSTSSRIGSSDQWGSIKIPRLPDLKTSTSDSNGWFPVPSNISGPESYSSLLGIPIIGLPKAEGSSPSNQTHKDTQVSFSLETSYVDLICPDMNLIAGQEESGGISVVCLDCGSQVCSTPSDRASNFLGPPFPSLSLKQQANPSITSPRTIQINSSVVIEGTPGIIQTNCSTIQRLVETFIECTSESCVAKKIRPSKTDLRSSNYTSFDYWGVASLDMINRANRPDRTSATTNGIYIYFGPTSSEQFLRDPNTPPLPLHLVMGGASDFNFSAVTPALFSARVSVLLNTALQLFMCPSCFAGNFPANLSLYGPDHLPVNGIEVAMNKLNWTMRDASQGSGPLFFDGIPFMAASTKAEVRRRVEVYEPHYGWLAVLITSAGAVFLLGLLGIYLKFATMIPNIFDSVVGLTYNNKYIPCDFQAGLLDSEDQLKMVFDERVLLGSVEHKDGGANFAFGNVAKIIPLDKRTRHYEIATPSKH